MRTVVARWLVSFCTRFARKAPINFKYCLINEQQCFIKFKTQGEAECFRLDKTRTANLLNGLNIY